MARRTYELVFNEDTPERSYDNRLGVEYTAGEGQAAMLYPDSQGSANQFPLIRSDIEALKNWCYDVLQGIDAAAKKEQGHG